MAKSASPPAWRVTGLIWTEGQAGLEWSAPDGRGERASPLPIGVDLAFTTGADRQCTGLWRAGRRHRCQDAAPLQATARSGQCAVCQSLDRSYSVAADTRMDDPRPFAVYLAHHGEAGIKVGITAVARGTARLLEQGALASTILSTGTLASARRTEHVLGAAMGLPDRVTTARKRTARAHPATPAARATDLLAAAARTEQVTWPEGQSRREPQPVDHCDTLGLPQGGLHPTAQVLPLAAGATVAGKVACTIGTDLYLDTEAGLVLLDTRLLTGWALSRATGTAFTAPLQKLDKEVEQDALF